MEKEKKIHPHKVKSLERAKRKALGIPAVCFCAEVFAEWVYKTYLYETEFVCKKDIHPWELGDTWEQAARKFLDQRKPYRVCPNCGRNNTLEESTGLYTCKYCEGESDTEF